MLTDKKKTNLRRNSPYNVFGAYYDRFMEHVPYSAWTAYLWRRACSIMGRTPANVLDLGCGTGQILAFLMPQSIEMIGLDRSGAMLALAGELVQGAQFLQADLCTKFPLATASRDWLISTHDCLNYIVNTEDLAMHFKEAARVLKPDGLYSADFVSLDNIRRHFAGKTRVYRLGRLRLVWSNHYDVRQQLLTSRLDFKDASAQVLREEHVQRFYTRNSIQELAEHCGLDTVLIEADYRTGKPGPGATFFNFHFKKKSP